MYPSSEVTFNYDVSYARVKKIIYVSYYQVFEYLHVLAVQSMVIGGNLGLSHF